MLSPRSFSLPATLCSGGSSSHYHRLPAASFLPVRHLFLRPDPKNPPVNNIKERGPLFNVVIEPWKKRDVVAAVVFLHGLGDNGVGWLKVINQTSQGFPSVRFILPHAPERNVEALYNLKVRAWFNHGELPPKVKDDQFGLQKSCKRLAGIIAEEIKEGTPPEKIMVGGFGQGGALALYFGLTYPQKLAGLFALSGYLPFPSDAMSKVTPNKTTPIFMGNPELDEVVPSSLAKESAEFLRSNGINIKFSPYPDQTHGVCMQEVDDLGTYIREVLFPERAAKGDLAAAN